MKLYSFALPFIAVAAVAATAVFGASSTSDDHAAATLELRDAGVHFQLRTSAPKADSTVAPTTEVRLWLTQVPQEGTTQIRVTKRDNVVPMTSASADPEDATSYTVSIERPLSPGPYKVTWRSMAADGHVVGGDFGFEVAAAAPIER